MIVASFNKREKVYNKKFHAGLFRFIWNSDCHDSDEPDCDDQQTSNATITWAIPSNQQTGTYQIRHDGFANVGFGEIQSYRATSRSFTVQ